MNINYSYVDGYKKIADAMLLLKDDKPKFVSIARKILNDTSWKEEFSTRKETGDFDPLNYIDPLTLLAIINGKTTERYSFLNILCKELDLNISFSKDEKFHGVSIINHNKRILADYRTENDYCDTNNKLWKIFNDAIKLADNEFKDDDLLDDLGKQYDLLEQNIKGSWDGLTHVFSYIRPESYIALSSPNRNILRKKLKFNENVNNYIESIDLKKINGKNYFSLCKILKNNGNNIGSLMELSQLAYEENLDMKHLKERSYPKEECNKTISEEKDVEKLKKGVDYKAPTKKQIKSNSFGRNQYTRQIVLVESNYQCQYDVKHNYFKSKATKENYVETHHIIPMFKQADYRFEHINLDVPENVVALCPICHLKLHRGINKDIKDVLNKIYKDRKADLKNMFNINDFNELFEFYKKSN